MDELELSKKKLVTQIKEKETFADKVANKVGSWRFIIIQTVLITLWVGANTYGYFIAHWDPYPFILLNLFLSFQAAYTAPIIMMSQNRMEQKDRERSILDFETNVKAEKEIEDLQVRVEDLHRKVDELLSKK
jgi:uncharacterized membrane protein